MRGSAPTASISTNNGLGYFHNVESAVLLRLHEVDSTEIAAANGAHSPVHIVLH